MPNMDGWQFIEARSHELGFASISVVLLFGQLNARETAPNDIFVLIQR